VFVDYAHTDDALENVLRTVRPLAEKKLLLVFGCGGNRDRTKRPLMGRIASRMADHTIITSDNPRREDPEQIVREIHAGFEGAATCEVILDRADAIQRAMALATPGDLVLIAGKGHEKNQEFSDRTVPFDDVRMARRFL
jgi:UDP-N-acetylmuramyl tripeptide synthase